MKILKIYNLNTLKLNNKYIFLILSNDCFLREIIKNNIINNINKKNTYIKKYYIDNNEYLLKILQINLNLNLFDEKNIIIIYLNNLFVFNKEIIYLLNIYNKNNIIIFIINYYIIFNKMFIFFNNIKNINVYYIKEINISYEKFIFFIKSILNKKYNISYLNKNIYNWLYIMYENNFIDINNIILFIIRNKKFKINNYYINKLSKLSLLNISYSSWIYLSLCGYKELSNLNLLILKINKNSDTFIKILKSLKIVIFFLIFNNSNEKKNIKYNNLFINNINIKYIKILLKSYINIEIIYKILNIITEIDFYIKNFNYKYENIIWNKLDLISLFLCKNNYS